MTARRSTGRIGVARALWYAKPGVVELRAAPLAPLAPGQARVRTQWSAFSRGTERLIFNGQVAKSEWERMRAPLQDGAFPFPVKYGYCATGVVEDGPNALVGRTVFCLHPHQDLFVAPIDMLAPVPDAVPARRATLAANMETALNAHWDAGTGPGDRIAVVGAGVVGLLVAHLAARIPGTEVTVYDVDETRRPLVEALGARFARSPATTRSASPSAPASPPPGGQASGVGTNNAVGRQASVAADVPAGDTPPGNQSHGDCDVVFHASVSAAGLQTAIDLAGMEATIVELSWYGDKAVSVGLGGAFHSRRLRLVASQVGQVSPARRPRWSYRRRLDAALALLTDPALDALVAEEIAFEDTPKRLPQILAPGAGGLAPVIRY